jgi:hypothetical protein
MALVAESFNMDCSPATGIIRLISPGLSAN